LAEASTPEAYGRAYGFERAMDSAGAIVGPLLATAILSVAGLRFLFLCTLVPGIMAALLIAFLVRERQHDPQHPQIVRRDSLYDSDGHDAASPISLPRY
jgi:MFS family permease